MKITGIIAEYNPFHNGHLYHMTKAREKTGADYVIIVMSGDFTQRGYPAITDKHLRTQMALCAGADLVLELPVCYATGSAEYFAKGAVSLLDGLGVVDTLCFGSEHGSLSSLTTVAKGLLAKDSADTISQLIGRYVREGHSYPKARSLSYAQIFPSLTSLQSVLSSPNNLLGIEYIKALHACGSQIKPVTIKRNGADYHDKALTLSGSSSASAIRTAIYNSGSLDGISNHIPKNIFELLSNEYQKKLPINADDFSLLLHYKLLREMRYEFTDYMDVSQELSDKIRNKLNHFNSFTRFCSFIKSKDLTHTRISRSLLHILLDLKKSDYHPELQKAPIRYARILGFQEHATPLLHEIKTHGDIPLLTKLSAASTLLSKEGIDMLQKDIDAAHLYEAVASAKFHTPFVHEYQKQIIVLPSQY